MSQQPQAERAWQASAAYAEMELALHATGYRTYADAQADGYAKDEERYGRWLRFHRRWSALMQQRCGIDAQKPAHAGFTRHRFTPEERVARQRDRRAEKRRRDAARWAAALANAEGAEP